MFEDEKIEITCAECGAINKIKLKEVRKSPTITCRNCGISIKIDAKEANRELKSIEDLMKSFGSKR